MCFQALHKKGSRRRHASKPIELNAALAEAAKRAAEEAVAASIAQGATGVGAGLKRPALAAVGDIEDDEDEDDASGEGAAGDADTDAGSASGTAFGGVSASAEVSSATGSASTDAPSALAGLGSATGSAGGGGFLSRFGFGSAPTPRPAEDLEGTSFTERSKFIPLRLSYEERKWLRLVEAALTVSEYTDKVDVLSAASKSRRILDQIRDICAILSGLLIACDFRHGQKLISNKEFKDYAHFFQTVFEIARRHKVMNPEKMRTEYGKLVYLLQDSRDPQINELLEFDCVVPIQTVYSLLETRDGLALLLDPLMEVATHEILPHGKSRPQIQREIKEKNAAQDKLARKYASAKLSPDDIKLCLYSINDNNSFLTQSRDPIDVMITYLKANFKAEKAESGYSLAIAYGDGGARLSHDHERQYHYVLQSLMLWREIAHGTCAAVCETECDSVMACWVACLQTCSACGSTRSLTCWERPTRTVCVTLGRA